MSKNSKFKIAVFFTILFMALISAPTVILSFDESADVSNFYSITEEEENVNFKLLFERTSELSENLILSDAGVHLISYTFKTYPKPHLNLISPPPDKIIS
ncbi:hypothetical protein [Winogradskyella bathintestinalis]|uniref:Uncharacterized protein n=1 Tax=Winogradskyella bathintestinalis TaxID=3035208 RepID=A0ABT7ZQW4_9FLAO|nr:hypothetical protein [Winogradskyella bathintestinalis]MDN3491377.1 hypothetical protein [Winogradskyella bathintestinalis]